MFNEDTRKPYRKSTKPKASRRSRKTAQQYADEFMAYVGFTDPRGEYQKAINDTEFSDGSWNEDGIEDWLSQRGIIRCSPKDKQEIYFRKKKSQVMNKLSQFMPEGITDTSNLNYVNNDVDFTPVLSKRRNLKLGILSEGCTPIGISDFNPATRLCFTDMTRPVQDRDSLAIPSSPSGEGDYLDQRQSNYRQKATVF